MGASKWTGKETNCYVRGIYCRPAFLSRGVAIFLTVSCFRNRDICYLSSVKTFFSVDGCVLMKFFLSLNSLNMFHCTWSGLLWVFSRKNRKKRKKKRWKQNKKWPLTRWYSQLSFWISFLPIKYTIAQRLVENNSTISVCLFSREKKQQRIKEQMLTARMLMIQKMRKAQLFL